MRVAQELRLRACAAKTRSERRVQNTMGGCSAEYWSGVQFGFEDAAQYIEDMLRTDVFPMAVDPK